ncbi:hypothetical protein, partial [Amycolatopsis lurida]|uniref:hypothetical protein n=1 Tax=Amycolatopsis lurida TaxID=31959 RepID=UPI0036600581
SGESSPVVPITADVTLVAVRALLGAEYSPRQMNYRQSSACARLHYIAALVGETPTFVRPVAPSQ